jgi:nitronate monooxygenase/enoyl-[acyl-carrier protein] reductase II
MLQTALARDLGIRVPVFSAGMAWVAGPEVASAVSNAGGCGVVGLAGTTSAEASARIRKTRALTDRPFGMNIILARLGEGQIEACLDERVPLIVFFWGDPAPYVAPAHQRGIKVLVQVGSVAEAAAAARAGVDGIIAQGVEAGGHVNGQTSLSILLPAVVEAVRPVPVIASGGIADGRGLAAALCLGAQGVSVGTRFVCSEEAFAARGYKDRIVRSKAEDTIYTQLFNVGWDAPHRVLRNRTVAEWEAKGCPVPGRRPSEGTVIGTAPRGDGMAQLLKYAANSYPTSGFDGDLENAVLYAGESCSLIHDVKPAAQIVRDFEDEARAIILGLGAHVTT